MAKDIMSGKTLATAGLIENEGPPTAGETVVIPVDQIHPSSFNPYNVNENSLEMEELVASIREHGLLEPLILRHRKEGGYEAVSGHRRLVALKKAGLAEARAEIRDMDDAHMKILMGQYNKYRTVTPRERARDYQQQIDGYRELIVSGEKSGRADFAVADMNGVNHQTIQNYLRLNYLIEPLGKLVDTGKLKVTPAIPLSYLTEELQADVLDQMEANDSTPSRHQALLLKDLFEKGKLDTPTIGEIITGRYREEKEAPAPKQPEPLKPEAPPEAPSPPPVPPVPSQPVIPPAAKPEEESKVSEAAPAPLPQREETEQAKTPQAPGTPPNAVPIMELLKESSETPDEPSPEPDRPPETAAPPPPETPAAEQVQADTIPEDSTQTNTPKAANEPEQPTPQQLPPQVSTAEPMFIQVPVNEVRRYFKPGTPSEQMRERLVEPAKLDWMKQRNQYSR